MTTQILDRVPVDAITERARSARPGMVALAVVGGVLFGAGWVTARLFSVLWLCVSWCWAAVAEGWQASHGPSRGSQIESLLAERESLRAQVARLGG